MFCLSRALFSGIAFTTQRESSCLSSLKGSWNCGSKISVPSLIYVSLFAVSHICGFFSVMWLLKTLVWKMCVQRHRDFPGGEQRWSAGPSATHPPTHTARQRLVPPVTASLMFLESIIKCFWWTWIGNGHSWTAKSETGWGFSVFADSAYLQKSLVHNPHEYGGKNVLTYVQELEQFDLLLFIAFKMLYLS